MVAGIVVLLAVIGVVVGTQVREGSPESTIVAATAEATTTPVVPTITTTAPFPSSTAVPFEPSTSTATKPTTTTLAATTTLSTTTTLSVTTVQDPPPPEGTVFTGLAIGPSTPLSIGVAPGWHMYEDDHPYLDYREYWSRQGNLPTATSGLYHRSHGESAIVYVAFEGTRIRLRCVRDSECGFAVVYLDDTQYLVDLYSADRVSEIVWASPYLEPGYHQLFMATHLPEKNPASSGRVITLDAVDVLGTLVEWDW